MYRKVLVIPKQNAKKKTYCSWNIDSKDCVHDCAKWSEVVPQQSDITFASNPLGKKKQYCQILPHCDWNEETKTCANVYSTIMSCYTNQMKNKDKIINDISSCTYVLPKSNTNIGQFSRSFAGLAEAYDRITRCKEGSYEDDSQLCQEYIYFDPILKRFDKCPILEAPSDSESDQRADKEVPN